jgi:hypothetical protein
VINGEGFLKTIRRHFSFCEHSGRIVDQDIDPRETSVKLFSQTMDLCLRRQVCEEQDRRVARSTLRDFRTHEIRPGSITSHHHDFRTTFR